MGPPEEAPIELLNLENFGVLLGKVLQLRSAAEGYRPALDEYPQAAEPLDGTRRAAAAG